jgi:hypothetical protein
MSNIVKTFAVAVISVVLASGCVSVKEAARGIAGTSTKILEETRADAAAQEFNYDYGTCYTKVKAALKEMGSYIYREEPAKQLIAVYVSEEDTTPIGIFLKTVSDTSTKVEVSSPSTYAKGLISARLFTILSAKDGIGDTPVK